MDELITELNVVNSLCVILSEHFNGKRYNDMSQDWYSLSRYINEYSDLLWTIQKKVNEIEKELIKLNEKH